MLNHLRVLAVALALACAAPAHAEVDCPEHFRAGQQPALVNLKLGSRTQVLCFTSYAVLFSGLTRTPLWSAEHLTGDLIADARTQARINNFHPELRLPAGERSELSDYARSGYDRGHMAPSGDMPDEKSQQESFSLANMIPQDPDNNRHLWERIEDAVRDLGQQEDDIFVVTGPVFSGESLQSLQGRVLVPTEIWKAVYVPSRKAGAAYLVRNAPGSEFEVISLAQLALATGLDVFPGLPNEIKTTAMHLPSPDKKQRDRQADRSRFLPEPKSTGTFVRNVLHNVDRVPLQ